MWQQLNKWANKESKKTVCVDVDGTILEYEGYEKNKFGKPITSVIDKLKELKERGISLVLSTARSEDEREALENTLKEHEIIDLFDEIHVGEKPIAVAYLDDKAVNVKKLEVWKDDLEELLKEK